ncbi:hypothetical protein [Ferruginibacter sp.]|nr:hypothetical protein [Ferruginibacter sp.]
MKISAQQFMPGNYGACFDYFPSVIFYTPDHQYLPQPGWKNAEEIKVYW